MKPHNRDAPLHSVYGIGESRAEQLHSAGIQTLYQLARADPSCVSDALDVNNKTARGYIQAAKTTAGYYGEIDE